jgi:hypothetical protein
MGDYSTLKIEETPFSVPSVFTRATRRNIPEDAIIRSHRRENLNLNIPEDDILHSDRCESVKSYTLQH